MVFVWKPPVERRPDVHAPRRVAVNDPIMVVAFAPIVGLAARHRCHHRPRWSTTLDQPSVVLYIVNPGDPRALWPRSLLAQGATARRRGHGEIGPFDHRAAAPRCGCCSPSRARRSSGKPLVIALLAVAYP